MTSLCAEFHAFSPDKSDIEREFSLTTQQKWDEFFAFLHGYLNEVSG